MSSDWRYLTVGKYKVKIDAEDYERVSEKSWRATRATTGRIRIVMSVRTPQGVRSITLGAFLMNPPKGKQVYPRRFNEGLDYRKSNLLVLTLSERQRLLPKNRKKASSEYRGVSYSTAEKKWKAGIEVNGKSINLGLFRTEDAAAAAYNKAAIKHFGEIAYQNPIGRSKTKRRD